MSMSNMPAISNGLMKALIEAMGLEDKRVTAIKLELRWNAFAKLTVERAPLEEQAQRLIDAVKAGLISLADIPITEEQVNPVMAKITPGQKTEIHVRQTADAHYDDVESLAIKRLAGGETIIGQSWRDREKLFP